MKDCLTRILAALSQADFDPMGPRAYDSDQVEDFFDQLRHLLTEQVAALASEEDHQMDVDDLLVMAKEEARAIVDEAIAQAKLIVEKAQEAAEYPRLRPLSQRMSGGVLGTLGETSL